MITEKYRMILLIGVSAIALPMAYSHQHWIMVGMTSLGLIWGFYEILTESKDTSEKLTKDNPQ